jgi:hypothetical protein
MTDWTRVFFDEFPAGEDVDRGKWTSPVWTPQDNKAFLGRTGIRNPKDFKGKPVGLIPCTERFGADLRFSTYNPEAIPPGSAFLGSEISTVQKWGGSGQKVKFEATVSALETAPGTVLSVFAYALCANAGRAQNEIDFEFAANYFNAVDSHKPYPYLTNVFVCKGGAGDAPVIQNTSFFFAAWNTFTIIYTPSESVEWLINGEQVRFDKVHVPDLRISSGIHLYMNFWAPQSDWGWAYNANLQPSGAPGQEWHYYVKNAAVYYG